MGGGVEVMMVVLVGVVVVEQEATQRLLVQRILEAAAVVLQSVPEQFAGANVTCSASVYSSEPLMRSKRNLAGPGGMA